MSDMPASSQGIQGYCRDCGKALAGAEGVEVSGALYCQPCLTNRVAANRPAAVDTSSRPGLALILGFIPGLGAVYNGQYSKALVHVLIFAGIVSILNHGAGGAEPFFGIGLAAFIVYMAIEAYRTAKYGPQATMNVDFGLNTGGVPVGPLLLIGLGVLFLLQKFDLIRIGRILDFWPVILIVVGIMMLRKRMQPNSTASGSTNP